MARIGRRDQLVTLERSGTGTDGYGEDTQEWAAIGQEWAAVYFGRGAERRQSAMEQGSQAASFGFLSNPITQGLKIADRVVHAGANWDIEGIALDTPKRGEIEITATRSA